MLTIMERRVPSVILSTLALAMAAVACGAIESQEKSHSTLALEELASLVGRWEGTQDGVEIKATYTVTANGSALMEEMQPAKSPVMITMFIVDADHLIATHYCSVGNQPQMVTAALNEPWRKSLEFSLVRVTGMKTPEDWHNTGLVVIMDDKDHIRQRWTYLRKGRTGTSVFHYTRAGKLEPKA